MTGLQRNGPRRILPIWMIPARSGLPSLRVVSVARVGGGGSGHEGPERKWRQPLESAVGMTLRSRPWLALVRTG